MDDSDQPANDGFSRLLREVDDQDRIASEKDADEGDQIDQIDQFDEIDEIDDEIDDADENDLGDGPDRPEKAGQADQTHPPGQRDQTSIADRAAQSGERSASGSGMDGDVIAILLFGLAVIVALALLV